MDLIYKQIRPKESLFVCKWHIKDQRGLPFYHYIHKSYSTS